MPTLIKNSDGTLLRNSNGTIANDQNCCCEEDVCDCPFGEGDSFFVDVTGATTDCSEPFYPDTDASSCFPTEVFFDGPGCEFINLATLCDIGPFSVEFNVTVYLNASCSEFCTASETKGCCWIVDILLTEPDDCSPPLTYQGYRCFDDTDLNYGIIGTYTKISGNITSASVS